MSRYEISAPARLGLLDIWNHIAGQNVDAADHVASDLMAAMELLVDFPELGHRRADVSDTRYKFWSVHSLVIAYLPHTKPLAISRIIHGRRDFRRLFPR
jgi:plasmid stabilization system protein ParE